jgi:hypothetical protein
MTADLSIGSERELLFEAFLAEGPAARRAVLGAGRPDRSPGGAHDFVITMQHISNESCWGPACGAPAGRDAFNAEHEIIVASGAMKDAMRS